MQLQYICFPPDLHQIRVRHIVTRPWAGSVRALLLKPRRVLEHVCAGIVSQREICRQSRSPAAFPSNDGFQLVHVFPVAFGCVVLTGIVRHRHVPCLKVVPVLWCPGCEQTLRCVQCDLALTYHRRIERLVCHGCCEERKVPTVCPVCRDVRRGA